MRSSNTPEAGLRLHIERLGRGDPVLLVHGALSSSADFRQLADLLAPSHSVVLLDRRGYGGSGIGSRPFSFAQDGADIVEVLERLPVPALVFGHSAGGLAALHAAQQRPDLISSLVLYEPAAASKPELLARYTALRAEHGEAAAMAAFIAAAGGPDEAALRVQMLTPEWAARLAMADAVERDLTAQVALPRPDRYDLGMTPVTVLVGEDSSPSTYQRASYLAEQLDGSRLHLLRGQGHLANLFAPDLLAHEVAQAADRPTNLKNPTR